MEKTRDRVSAENHEGEHTKDGTVGDFEATDTGYDHAEGARGATLETEGGSKFECRHGDEKEKHACSDGGQEPTDKGGRGLTPGDGCFGLMRENGAHQNAHHHIG